MDNRSEIKKKLKPITEELSSSIVSNFPKIILQFENSYQLSDIDPIRHEICLCLLYSLNQASITLTNHLLEKFLKLALVYKDAGKIGATNLYETSEIFEKVINKYNDNDLQKTINQCCTKGIITKEDKKILNQIREKYRNAYSHADIEKTFGEGTIPLAQGNFSNPEKIEIGEFKIKNFPMIQGIIQKKIADDIAYDYFIFVDELIRKSIDKIF